MFGNNNILEYGIAVNFLGNYRSEGGVLNSMTRELTGGLMNLQSLLIGGGLVAAFSGFASKIMSVGTMMEQNFANLKATLGSTAKALEQLEWARVKGATTPFEIDEVNQALSMMHMMGFAKNNKQREDTFDSVGNFAALRGYGFADVLSRVARASFGNWEALGDSFGIRKQTIGDMARGRVSKNSDAFSEEQKAGLEGWIKQVEKGKNGTVEMKEAIVNLIGILGQGGLEAKLNTVGGVMSNLSDIVANFWFNLVGYSQVEGTLFNQILKTLRYVNDEFSKTLTTITVLEKQTDGTTKSIEKTVNAIDMLGNIGAGVGQILVGAFGGVDNAARNATDGILGHIQRINEFFADYKNNIAPIILFVGLLRIQIEEFVKSMWEGFKTGFGLFTGVAMKLWEWLVKIVDWTGLAGENADALGYTIGAVTGGLLGLKVVGLLLSPFTLMLRGAIATKNAVQGLWKVLTQSKAISKATTALRGLSVANGTATASTWGFNAALLANPITWVVVAVVGLIAWLAYLATHWDEVGESMKGVSDWVKVLLAVFVPFIGVPLIMAEHWTSLKNTWGNVWEAIKNYTLGAWLVIDNEVFKPIKEFFSEVTFFDPFIEKLKSVWEYLKDIGAIINETLKGSFLGDWFDWGEEKSVDMKNDSEDFLNRQKEKYNVKDKLTDQQKRLRELYSTNGAGAAPTVHQEAETKNDFNGANITIQLPNVTNPEEFANTNFNFVELANIKGK